MVINAFEKYHKISDECVHIRQGKSHTYTFSGDGICGAERIFFAGDAGIAYLWKSEPDYQMLYRRIDDSLNASLAERDRYCLDLSDCPKGFSKVAYKKLVAPLSISHLPLASFTDDWSFGISVKAEGLSVRGYLRVLCEVRLMRDGEDAASTLRNADCSFTINIPDGTYPLTELSERISFDSKNLASVSFFVEGEDYTGKVFFECPFFKSFEGRNLIPPFQPHTEDRAHFNWVGQNLSRAEWPSLRIELNGKIIHDGEIFDRCHRGSESEISIAPEDILPGENAITFTSTSDFRDAPGYDLCEIGVISTESSRIVSVPSIVAACEPFSVFVFGKAGDKVEFSSSAVRALSPLTLEYDGINALLFVTDTVGGNIPITILGEERVIARSVKRENDGVITGTGDMIYVNANARDAENYLKWYLSEEIGNLLTIRPTYRWCGTRIYNPDVWKNVARVLSFGKISYAHMLDGRELPGGDCNPTEKELCGDFFLGRQTHEFDGQFAYWGFLDITAKPSDDMFWDLFIRMHKKHPDRTNLAYLPENRYFADGHRTVFRPYGMGADMKESCECFVESLKKTRKGTPRHTGPSTLFKYFYEAGYKWVGAELLYTPTELTASSLRGARGEREGNIGAHLAIQWSTSPHDTQERYKRYFLGLFISYIQGIDEINTEEGLWHIEEYYSAFNRFSTACREHTRVQKDFYKYIRTHTRRGKFYTPIAFLSGRYDGWQCFVRGNVWGNPKMPFGEPEASWDILKYFYPRSVLDAIYVHNCPNESVGYYSGTPRGNVDIIPIERGDYSKYKLLIAPGYNAAHDEDIKSLSDYVECGGSLIIGWPQLSTSTDRDAVISYRHEYLPFFSLPKSPEFCNDTYKGEPLSLARDIPTGEVLIKSDTGAPIVIKYKHGEGSVYFVNAREYAARPAVTSVYEKLLDISVGECLSKEDIYATGDSNVQFAVYEDSDGARDIYFIATDWFSENGGGEGRLIIGKNEYKLPVSFGEPIKVRAKGGIAIYPTKSECEVIKISDTSAEVQGVGMAEFVCLSGGTEKRITVDFGCGGVARIDLCPTN